MIQIFILFHFSQEMLVHVVQLFQDHGFLSFTFVWYLNFLIMIKVKFRYQLLWIFFFLKDVYNCLLTLALYLGFLRLTFTLTLTCISFANFTVFSYLLLFDFLNLCLTSLHFDFDWRISFFDDFLIFDRFNWLSSWLNWDGRMSTLHAFVSSCILPFFMLTVFFPIIESYCLYSNSRALASW